MGPNSDRICDSCTGGTVLGNTVLEPWRAFHATDRTMLSEQGIAAVVSRSTGSPCSSEGIRYQPYFMIRALSQDESIGSVGPPRHLKAQQRRPSPGWVPSSVGRADSGYAWCKPGRRTGSDSFVRVVWWALIRVRGAPGSGVGMRQLGRRSCGSRASGCLSAPEIVLTA